MITFTSRLPASVVVVSVPAIDSPRRPLVADCPCEKALISRVANPGRVIYYLWLNLFESGKVTKLWRSTDLNAIPHSTLGHRFFPHADHHLKE